MSRIVTGDKELDRMLQKLKVGAANKIARPAIRKAARHLLKAMKGNVPSKYRDLKRSLGMRVDSKGGTSRKEPQAKVGAGVGKGSKHQSSRSGRKGVGIGGRNIHWFLLGTGDRRTKAGRRTGRMGPLVAGLVQSTASSQRSTVQSIIRSEVLRRLEQEARK